MKIQYTCGNHEILKNINNLKFKLVSSDENDVISEIDRLNSNKELAHNIPLEYTINLLDRCAKLWLNKDYYSKHVEILSKTINQDPELVSYELKNTMKMLLKKNIKKMIIEELGNLEVLDKWIQTSYGFVHRQPRGLTFHNISGNAFVVIPMSICMGLLSKNCNLIKVSGDEPYFAYAFYQSLYELDYSIKDRLSVIYFDSERSDIYETLVKSSDCVIHWGGEYSGKIMAELCAKHQTHIIMHGPKISFEVIDSARDISYISQLVANDIVCWEQKACLSPRVVFINNKINVKLFAEMLGESLKSLTSLFPKAYLNAWNSVKTIQDRQYCLLKYGLDYKQEIQVFSSYNADYTVILNNTMPDKLDIDRCFNRFIFVCPYESKEEVYNYVSKNLKEYLQTMGYNGYDNNFIEYMTLLGVSIVTKPGEMPLHYSGTSHDGMHNLNEMTFIVSRQLSLKPHKFFSSHFNLLRKLKNIKETINNGFRW